MLPKIWKKSFDSGVVITAKKKDFLINAMIK